MTYLNACLISFACCWLYFGAVLPLAVVIGRGIKRGQEGDEP